MKKWLFLFFLALAQVSIAQHFTASRVGNPNSILANASFGVCLMGGGIENDSAMAWFLRRANGGDVVVLRASGGNGYNNYMHTGLGVPINSVETFVCHNRQASYDTYLIQRLQEAEAVWFTGGNQSTYINYWRNSPVDSILNARLAAQNLVIGGTSAGMAILGRYYFSAQNGTIDAATALNDPFHPNVTVDTTLFISITQTQQRSLIFDTHFDNPDRKGRLITFMARLILMGRWAHAMACDENTALVMDHLDWVHAYGDYPQYDDNAYFATLNCLVANNLPEVCTPGQPLTWDQNGAAVKTLRVKGTPNGQNRFNTRLYFLSSGAEAFNWWVIQGQFFEDTTTIPNCSVDVQPIKQQLPIIRVYPNPVKDLVQANMPFTTDQITHCSLLNAIGQTLPCSYTPFSDKSIQINTSNLSIGIYFLQITNQTGQTSTVRFVKAF